MRLRAEARRAVLGLGLLVSTVLAQGQVQFYFSAPGGDTSRLTADDVDTFGWTGEYDVIVKNTSGATIIFNSGCLMIGFAETTGEGPSASITPGSNKVTLLNMANAEAPPSSNPNFGTLPSWFSGSFGCLLGGGRGVSGPTRPYGLSLTTDVAFGTTQSIGAGQEFLLCRVKFADNGLFSAGGSHDLVLYDGGSTGSFTTALFKLPGASYRPGANWYAGSKLTLNAGGSNQPPVLNAIGDRSVREEELLTFTASATDPDAGQVLTYSLTGDVPYGAYIQPLTGVFTWRPSAIQTPQVYTFNVVVSDNGAPVGNDFETITVTAARETRAATSVWTWGSNVQGVGGLGSNPAVVNSPTLNAGYAGISRIFRGYYHTFARMPDGSWLGSGWNLYNQLADGTTDDRTTPVSLPALANLIDIGGGIDSNVGIDSTGNLLSWGTNDFGQLGNGTFDPQPTLTPTSLPSGSLVRTTTSSYETPFAIVADNAGPIVDGSLYGWGWNPYGGLGTGAFAPPEENPDPVILAGLPPAIKAESDLYHSIALFIDGTVRCWGRNNFGQIGDGTVVNRPAPVVVAISDVVDVDNSERNSYALKRDGTVWSWGSNASGALGNGASGQQTTPVQVIGLTNVIDIEAASWGALALKADGTVWAWGSNPQGILGNGGIPFSSNVPVQVPGLSGISRIAAFEDTYFAWSYAVATNQAPVLDPIGNRTVAEGSALSLDANATDPDAGQTLTYSLTGAPAGMTIDGGTGVVSWTPSETQGPGSYPITIVVTDNGSPAQSDSEAITITVEEANQPPILVNPGAQTANENSAFTLQLTGSDADLPAQPLTYGLVTGPAGLTVSPTGLVLWTPGDSDGGTSPSVTVSLSDGVATVQQTFTISVTEDNQPPIVNGVVDRYGVMGTLFWLVLDVTDPDGPSTFTYSLGSGAPAGMTLDANGLLKWVPTGAQVGTHTFDIIVTDSGVPAATTTRSVTMTVAPPGRLRTWGFGGFGSPPPGTFRSVDGGYNYHTAVRSNGELAGWGNNYSGGVSPLPPGSFFSTSNGIIASVALTTGHTLVNWGSNAGSPPTGTYLAAVAADTFPVAVREDGTVATWAYSNYPAVPMPSGKFSLIASGYYHAVGIRPDGTLEDFGYNYYGQLDNTPTGTFKDVAAGERHSVAIRTDGTLASWGSDFGWDGTFHGQVSGTPLGTYLKVAAGRNFSVALRTDGTLVAWGDNTDGQVSGVPSGSYVDIACTAYSAVAIRSNQTPTFTNPGPQTASEQTPFSLQLSGSDPDIPADPLTYALVSGPSGLTVSASGLVQWTPGETDGGTAPDVTVSLSDGAETVQTTFTITVAETNQNPVLTDPADLAVNEGSLASVSLTATDPDLPAQSLTYSKVSGPGSVSGSTWSWTPGESDGPGNQVVVVQVSDGTATASQSFNVTVNEENQPPVLVSPGPQTATENSAFTLQMSGSDSDLPAQGLNFAKVAGPSGLTVSPTGLVLWTPGESDGGTSPNVTVSLSDGVATVQQTFTISVTEDNQPPIVNGVVDRYGVMGTLFWLVLDVTDPDGPSTFTYSLGSGAPAGMTLDANGLLKWVPTGAQVGTHTFNIIVTDSGVPAATTTRSVTMTVASAGRLEVWGDDRYNVVSQKPSGVYIEVGTGLGHGVALRPIGSIALWGTNTWGVITKAQPGPFSSISAGRYFNVALRSDSTIASWGWYAGTGGMRPAPVGRFLKAASGHDFASAISEQGYLSMWGMEYFNYLIFYPPSGKFIDVAAGGAHTSAIRSDGTLFSWGYGAAMSPPTGTFKAVASGNGFSVAIRTDGTLVAWGVDNHGIVSNVPAGNYFAVAAGIDHAIALRTDGTLVSWGLDFANVVTNTPSGQFSSIGSGGWSQQAAIRRNYPPVLTNPGPKAATEHQMFSLQLAATDVETPAGLTYSLVSGPGGMNVSSTGLVSWTPNESFGGNQINVTMRVSDGIDSDTETFAINIAEANGAPVCQNDVETVGRGTFKDIDVRANDYDPEGGTFLITGASSPSPNYGTVTIVNGGTKVRFSASSSPFFVGKICKFTYGVIDAFGATSSAQVSVTIK